MFVLASHASLTGSRFRNLRTAFEWRTTVRDHGRLPAVRKRWLPGRSRLLRRAYGGSNRLEMVRPLQRKLVTEARLALRRVVPESESATRLPIRAAKS